MSDPVVTNGNTNPDSTFFNVSVRAWVCMFFVSTVCLTELALVARCVYKDQPFEFDQTFSYLVVAAVSFFFGKTTTASK